MSTHSIVVGYDASQGAEAALAWALDHSSRSGMPITLAFAVEWQGFAGPLGLAPAVWPDESARAAGEEAMTAAVARARQSHPDVTISGTVTSGDAAAVLVAQSRQAALVVMGARGHSRFADLMVGSTSTSVSAHAHCPVVVVRGEQPPSGGPVVVGYDGSDLARLAVEFAFTEAATRGAGLRLIHAWTPPPPRLQPPGFDLRLQTAAEQSELAEVAARWQDKYPEVQVSVEAVAGPAAQALVEASRDARLVVVGSRDGAASAACCWAR
ncbi:universal stress protein [Phytohabitans suffuscus]|uniref:Universal stress protein n=1 Tax=Phytohabitans suffuscus TaxID=624315 RepID=A0A6F8Z0D5_9ACTN|nr:universal stress protein [Phytohabitans suffuscus]